MNIKRVVCMSMVAGMIIGCSTWGKKKVEVRPITVKVVDEKTGKPIVGLPVYRIVQVYYGDYKRLFGVIPTPEGKIVDRVVLKQNASTNEEGIITFEKEEVVVKKKEDLYKERIIINIQPTEEHLQEILKEEEIDVYDVLNEMFFYPGGDIQKYLTNPDYRYKGIYMLSMSYLIDKEDINIVNYEKFDWVQISYGLKKEKEEITIKLRRNSN